MEAPNDGFSAGFNACALWLAGVSMLLQMRTTRNKMINMQTMDVVFVATHAGAAGFGQAMAIERLVLQPMLLCSKIYEADANYQSKNSIVLGYDSLAPALRHGRLRCDQRQRSSNSLNLNLRKSPCP
jgi:hypothetical protein